MKKILFILVITLLFAGCVLTPAKYPTTTPNTTDIISSIRTIQTSYTMIAGDNERAVIKFATSYHIGGGYIVTAAHCVYFPTMTTRMPWGHMEMDVKTFDYVYKIKDKEVALIGTSDDIALLFDINAVDTQHIRWYDSDNLLLGDQFLLVGNSGMRGINIKTGIVSMLELKNPILGLNDRTAKATFVITAPVNYGDSGGPLFMFIQNGPYVIGMCYAVGIRAQGYNYAIKSNYILDMIDEIKMNARHK